jgi:catechol 2,3-dioxygenase-like lactoylglutathione lyase family enzyme
MVKFGHVNLPVADPKRSRDWYVNNFGFEVEFDRGEIIAIRDNADLTIFLYAPKEKIADVKCGFALEVDDAEAKYRELTARGVKFEKPPGKYFWGYGAELRDPDGYNVSVWDEKSMREKGGG